MNPQKNRLTYQNSNDAEKTDLVKGDIFFRSTKNLIVALVWLECIRKKNFIEKNGEISADFFYANIPFIGMRLKDPRVKYLKKRQRTTTKQQKSFFHKLSVWKKVSYKAF
jgi:hypothetical protein